MNPLTPFKSLKSLWSVGSSLFVQFLGFSLGNSWLVVLSVVEVETNSWETD